MSIIEMQVLNQWSQWCEVMWGFHSSFYECDLNNGVFRFVGALSLISNLIPFNLLLWIQRVILEHRRHRSGFIWGFPSSILVM